MYVTTVHLTLTYITSTMISFSSSTIFQC